MDTTKVFLDLALSLGVGLLVGLQRERVGSSIAGIRTFPLIALAGTVAASLPAPVNAWAVVAGLLAVVGLGMMGNWSRTRGQARPGVTTEAAMVLMFFVGALVVFGPRSAAVAVGAAAAVLLHAKRVLHRFTQRMDDADLHAIMQFAVISLIILPVAPNRAYGPFGALNPQKIWLLVVFIVGISLAAYVAYRLLGHHKGTILAGVLGGLISSTATTVSFARRTRDAPASAPFATLAIIIASTILCVRLLIVLWVAARAHWFSFAGPIGILAAVGLGCALIARMKSGGDSAPLPAQKNPTQLSSALIFAVLFAAVLLATAAGRHYFGDRGIYVIAFISGLPDLDAIALSTGKLVSDGSLGPDIGVRAILIALIANTVFKTVLAGVLGGRRLFLRLAPFMAIHLAVGIALLWWTPQQAAETQRTTSAPATSLPFDR
ncbi:MAG TPA: MgtC/SapB family protein [Phycisphaerae bacterium]|nr:MgtC/SapB family protein [Phycisphaerae bacterium]